MKPNLFLLFAVLLPCAGAQPTLSAPALGYVFDPGMRAIRSVRGIPGAAVLGDAIRARFALAAAEIAPGQDYALGVSRRNGVQLIRWNGQPPSALALEGAMAGAGRIVFSPSGSAAVLYDGRSGRMQLLTGLPAEPALQDLPPAAGPVFGLAVADDALVVFADGDNVRAIGPGLNAGLPLPGGCAALAFRSSSHDLLTVTGQGDVYLAKNVDANLSIRQVYGGGSQTSDPVAAQFSADASTAFVATRTGALAAIDLNSGAVNALSCSCAPTGLQPFGRPDLFRLTGISGRPVFLFDGTPAHNRLWFIPADSPRSQR